MKPSITTRLFSALFAGLMTGGIFFSLHALATTGQSADALLAQQGPLTVVCADPARRT